MIVKAGRAWEWGYGRCYI